VSVDTYAKKANKSAYQLVKEKGVEILISNNLASKAAAILVEQKKFLFFKWITVRAQLYGHAS
jgi:predicted Fe-Mo cluster-binding NifX family protein